MNSQASSRGVGEPGTGAEVKNMVWPRHPEQCQGRVMGRGPRHHKAIDLNQRDFAGVRTETSGVDDR